MISDTDHRKSHPQTAMPHSTALEEIYPAVWQHLQRWSGHEKLMRTMEKFPDLSFFLAGGVVRDCLLNVSSPVKDFDFFLRGPSVKAAVEFLAEEGHLRRTPYGGARWYPDSTQVQYADLIPIEDFKPGLWKCEDILDVLNQFDFTINAVAFDLRTGESFDPQNGVRDVFRRTMKMVRFDYPEGPFVAEAELSRNAVLWFRILHYAKVLGLTIEPLTLDWLKAHRSFQEYAVQFGDLFFTPHFYLDTFK